jgi:hypothetical protein
MTQIADHYAKGLPRHMAHLPIDPAGRPVPRFVETIDGHPDFRIMSRQHMMHCILHRACWVCGEPLGKYLTFTSGPMCLINSVSAEPPAHLDCATYSATHCPFLLNPDRDRRTNNLPDGWTEAAGTMITRNPGVVAVITSTAYVLSRCPEGVLFIFGPPEHVEWFAEGRAATQAEVLASVASGLPLLYDADRGQPTEAEAHRKLSVQIAAAARWYPA